MYQDVSDFFSWRRVAAKNVLGQLDIHNAFEACCAFKTCRSSAGLRSPQVLTGLPLSA